MNNVEPKRNLNAEAIVLAADVLIASVLAENGRGATLELETPSGETWRITIGKVQER